MSQFRTGKRAAIGMPDGFAVLSVDQAANSGWALHVGAKLVDSGEASTHKERISVLSLVIAMLDSSEEWNDFRSMPCVVLFEDHSKQPARKGQNTASVLGMGKAKGWWEACLMQADHDHRARMQTPPVSWKSEVLGLPRATATEACIAKAQQHALALGVPDAGPDQAVAIVMGHWAVHAPEAWACFERAFGPKAAKRRVHGR